MEILNKISRYFFLCLFLEYYLSITLFTHTHIVDGVTIVHSHPYKSGDSKNPVNHHHTTNGFILIHFLSNILITVAFLWFSVGANKAVFRKTYFEKNHSDFSNLSFLYSYGLRAPPLNAQVN